MPDLPAASRLALLVLMLPLVFATAHAASAPVVLYTDAVSGPTSGGEGGHGAYLSIFGRNFGSASGMGTTTRVRIGGVEVANYRFLGLSKVGATLGTQQLTVQVGALGAPMPGVALPITVTVSGVSSNGDLTFTPNPGRVLFVSLAGDDATAVAGDISRPWRHLQTAARGGAYATLRAGDHLVVRGGSWSDLGFDTAWLRFRDPAQQGSAPSGAIGTGWIHITAYPGPIGGTAVEDVHYTTPAGAKGGIQGPGSAFAATTGEYVSVSNLRIDVNAAATSDAAPINVQYTAGHWRIVNDELGPWPSTLTAPGNARAGGVSGCGDGVSVLGDDIHDIGCDPAALENHGIYADTGAQNWEVAWCHIHDIPGGSLVQFNDALGGSGTATLPGGSVWPGFVGLRVHHNRLENAAKYGLNIADNGAYAGRVECRAWNNVITGTRLPPIRMNSTATQMDATFAHNTIHQAMVSFSGSGNGYFRNEGLGAAPRVIRVYDNLLSIGPATIAGTTWFSDQSGSSGGWSFRNNLYWDAGRGLPGFTADTSRVIGDPRFVNPAAGDLSLSAASPAIDAARQALPFTIGDDATGTVARPQGAANDIGAYEAVVGGGPAGTGSGGTSAGTTGVSSSGTGTGTGGTASSASGGGTGTSTGATGTGSGSSSAGTSSGSGSGGAGSGGSGACGFGGGLAVAVGGLLVAWRRR